MAHSPASDPAAPRRYLLPTADGSHTVAIGDGTLTYHSRHGAIGESVHVFIRAGLDEALARHASDPLQLLEIGFGTGLNAFLTALEAERQERRIAYTAVEPFPLTVGEAAGLNYPEQLGAPDLFTALHACPWETTVPVTERFQLHKTRTGLFRLMAPAGFHLIYFDAFAPDAQPELWTEAVFRQLYRLLLPGGMLVTYCSKSVVRRAMAAAGFTVVKVPGPFGKRDMVRAVKAS